MRQLCVIKIRFCYGVRILRSDVIPRDFNTEGLVEHDEELILERIETGCVCCHVACGSCTERVPRCTDACLVDKAERTQIGEGVGRTDLRGIAHRRGFNTETTDMGGFALVVAVLVDVHYHKTGS